MKVFINGIGNISPQKTWDNNLFLDEVIESDSNCLRCTEPGDYEKLIDPKLLRRMSRIIRMSYSSARICLDDAGIAAPDAIITGSGMGCLEDTEKFLLSIYENDEKFLPPTPFIQSTHNTIGAQIALMLQCTNYNVTYSQRGISFENAMTDALLLLNEPTYRHILVGGFDEMTDNQMILYNRLNYYKKVPINNLGLLNSGTPGTIAGEGNTFFILSSEKNERSYAALSGITTFNNHVDADSVSENITNFLTSHNLTFSEIDLFVAGYNGDANSDKIYYEISKRHFSASPVAAFKHLCGEYHTASAFALWMAANILKKDHIPEAVRFNPAPARSIKNILIYNHYRNKNHSLMLLSSCQ
jgi:3-oxoacyl-(acyl-carrier-protein) synthase